MTETREMTLGFFYYAFVAQLNLSFTAIICTSSATLANIALQPFRGFFSHYAVYIYIYTAHTFCRSCFKMTKMLLVTVTTNGGVNQ